MEESILFQLGVFLNQIGKIIYARSVGLAKNVAYPLKQRGHIQEKQEAMNQIS